MSKDSRMTGSSITKDFTPRTTCTSHTQFPVGTLFSVWHGSRHSYSIEPFDIEYLYTRNIDTYNCSIMEKGLIQYLRETYPEYDLPGSPELVAFHHIITQVVKLAIKVDVQASEFVSYEFRVDDASVAWREQLVRKRQLHVWTQTSRVADMTSFDSTMMPSVDLLGGHEATEIYKNTVDTIRKAYSQLIELGVPSEDIRLQPQSHIHRVYFGGTLRSILKLVEDRTSWIAQATLWTPIVSGIVATLRTTLGDWILDLLKPPATVSKSEDGKYTITDYKLVSDDQARYEGHDPLPVSPIYLAYKGLSNNYKNKEFYDYMKSMYIKIWSDDILKAIDWDKDNPTKPGKYDVGYEGGKSNE